MAMRLPSALLLAALPLSSLGIWRDCSEVQAESVTHMQLEVLGGPIPQSASAANFGRPNAQATLVNRGGELRSIMVESWYFSESKRLESEHTWVPVANITTDLCVEHSGLCPLSPNSRVEVALPNPPLVDSTPAGRYRVTHVLKGGAFLKPAGCVSMEFERCSAPPCGAGRASGPTAPRDLSCALCKKAVKTLLKDSTPKRCDEACEPLGLGPLCSMACSLIKDLCKAAVDCSEEVCEKLGVCDGVGIVFA